MTHIERKTGRAKSRQFVEIQLLSHVAREKMRNTSESLRYGQRNQGLAVLAPHSSLAQRCQHEPQMGYLTLQGH